MSRYAVNSGPSAALGRVVVRVERESQRRESRLRPRTAGPHWTDCAATAVVGEGTRRCCGRATDSPITSTRTRASVSALVRPLDRPMARARARPRARPRRQAARRRRQRREGLGPGRGPRISDARPAPRRRRRSRRPRGLAPAPPVAALIGESAPTQASPMPGEFLPDRAQRLAGCFALLFADRVDREASLAVQLGQALDGGRSTSCRRARP